VLGHSVVAGVTPAAVACHIVTCTLYTLERILIVSHDKMVSGCVYHVIRHPVSCSLNYRSTR